MYKQIWTNSGLHSQNAVQITFTSSYALRKNTPFSSTFTNMEWLEKKPSASVDLYFSSSAFLEQVRSNKCPLFLHLKPIHQQCLSLPSCLIKHEKQNTSKRHLDIRLMVLTMIYNCCHGFRSVISPLSYSVLQDNHLISASPRWRGSGLDRKCPWWHVTVFLSASKAVCRNVGL